MTFVFKIEYILLFIIIIFILYTFLGSCRCVYNLDKFRVGNQKCSDYTEKGACFGVCKWNDSTEKCEQRISKINLKNVNNIDMLTIIKNAYNNEKSNGVMISLNIMDNDLIQMDQSATILRKDLLNSLMPVTVIGCSDSDKQGCTVGPFGYFWNPNDNLSATDCTYPIDEFTTHRYKTPSQKIQDRCGNYITTSSPPKMESIMCNDNSNSQNCIQEMLNEIAIGKNGKYSPNQRMTMLQWINTIDSDKIRFPDICGDDKNRKCKIHPYNEVVFLRDKYNDDWKKNKIRDILNNFNNKPLPSGLIFYNNPESYFQIKEYQRKEYIQNLEKYLTTLKNNFNNTLVLSINISPIGKVDFQGITPLNKFNLPPEWTK